MNYGVRVLKSWLLVLLVAMVAGSAEAFEAGAAKVDITPPLGTPLNGYGYRLGRGAVAVHDPVSVRCLYMSDGETPVLLLCADLCMIGPELRERVLELCPREIPHKNVFLSATHTHSAQGGMVRDLVFRAVSGRFVPEVLEETAKGFGRAMREAYERRERASIGYGAGRQPVPKPPSTSGEDKKEEEEPEPEPAPEVAEEETVAEDVYELDAALSTNRRIKGGPIDPQIGVIRIDDADGTPIAIVANFAGHPTTVGDDDGYAVSADYPGYYYVELERLVGAECVALFTNGAEGNQRCTNPEGKAGWERTESVGRLLAKHVKAIADTVACSEAKLRVTSAAPELPPSIMGSIAPRSAILKTLEINDALLTFVPGEACVEIAIGLRERALARGYAMQFTVGLSSDFLAYFAPREYYPYLYYETSMNFYGPYISEWMWREFSKLMTRGVPGTESKHPATPSVESEGGFGRVVLQGSARDIGYQQGAVFRDEILAKFESAIVEPVDSGTLLPDAWYWRQLRPYFNTTRFAVPALAIGSRLLLQGVPDNVFEELDGIAEGTGLPFDAVWLVQCAPTFATQPNLDEFYRTAMCTMFAAVGDRAGADDLLVGRNFDWQGDGAPVMFDVRPETGHRFMRIAFPWSAGAFTGMNDAGLVLCVERMSPLGNPAPAGAPIEFVLRDILQRAGGLGEAVAILQSQPHLRGYHVLVAAPGAPGACVVELGETVIVRNPEQGLLLGAHPASATADEEAKVRYERVMTLLGGEHIVSAAKIRGVLADSDVEQSGLARIWNEHTKYAIVFEPKAGRFHIAPADGMGRPGEYLGLSLKGDTS